MDEKFRYKGDIVTRTIEECSELIHILCKIRRFGKDNWNPYDPKKTTNREWAQKEKEDVERCLKELGGYLKK